MLRTAWFLMAYRLVRKSMIGNSKPSSHSLATAVSIIINENIENSAILWFFAFQWKSGVSWRNKVIFHCQQLSHVLQEFAYGNLWLNKENIKCKISTFCTFTGSIRESNLKLALKPQKKNNFLLQLCPWAKPLNLLVDMVWYL